jgi:glycosyltransferase involved in cell wall biosynthesis
MPTQPDYSIIIPAFNEAAELPATLASIHRAMAAQEQVGECIVVDNNSSDQTATVAQSAGADRVVYEAFNQIARARNTGAANSRGRLLIFIDADTRIDPALLSEALRLLNSATCVGGGSTIEFEGDIGAIGRTAIAVWTYISTLTRTAAGSFLFCRRDAFEAIGGFDQKLYAAEEIRLSRLLRKWGRGHQLSFDIIPSHPVRTSERKLQWYNGPQMFGWICFMMLVPIAVRSRRLCGFWYDRPLNK